jgi:hypothetical protein
MRASIGIVSVAYTFSVVFAADVRDLGVPAGWRASDYDRHGYDLLNKHGYENARRYFEAAIYTSSIALAETPQTRTYPQVEVHSVTSARKPRTRAERPRD